MELPIGAQTEAATDRVLPRPQPFGRRFAEDDGSLRLAGFRLKVAAEEQGNAKRLKVVSLNIGVVDERPLVLGRRYFSIE